MKLNYPIFSGYFPTWQLLIHLSANIIKHIKQYTKMSAKNCTFRKYIILYSFIHALKKAPRIDTVSTFRTILVVWQFIFFLDQFLSNELNSELFWLKCTMSCTIVWIEESIRYDQWVKASVTCWSLSAQNSGSGRNIISTFSNCFTSSMNAGYKVQDVSSKNCSFHISLSKAFWQ